MSVAHLLLRRQCVVAIVAIVAASPAAAIEDARATITLLDSATAGIDARERDRPLPGAMTVDAVHRSVLLQFPRVANEVAKLVASGLSVARAEILLDHDGYEVVPRGYAARPGLGESKWRQDPPRWHLVAWALRRPWIADASLGPTFNSYINGAGYWTAYGAGNDEDRHANRYGPVELSGVNPIARIEVTDIFNNPAFGDNAVSRAAMFRDRGILIRKLETYDSRYRDWSDPYEWAVATGGHGLRFKNPRLELTLRSADGAGAIAPVAAPELDIAHLARSLRSTGAGGNPTAVLPTSSEFAQVAARLSIASRQMSSHARQRINELARIGGGAAAEWSQAIDRNDYASYQKLIGDILATPPRYWKGWSIHEDLLVWYLYRELLPKFVQEHIRSYWHAWLMPGVPTARLAHPQGVENLEHWKTSQDWRGIASFFRGAYTHDVSTQNFNQTASAGALLGGAIVSSPYAIEDGRQGLEKLSLRFWTFLDGSTQEMLDHYYFSITLSGQKMLADFAPSRHDRLMAGIALDRSIELLASAYHPSLRRMVGPSGRTNLQAVLVQQDGIYGVLHTLSKRGTLKYLDRPLQATVEGMRIWGDDFPPGRVGVQSVAGAWGPDWVSHMVDNKPLPFEETSAETTRGSFNPPLWRRSYLGRHYGLASQDIRDGVVDVIAQWNSSDQPSETVADLGTLTLRYTLNEASMSSTRGGQIPHPGGVATFQYRNRAIVFTKPRTEEQRLMELAGPDGLKTLATVIALWNFRRDPQWEIYVDGRRIADLPATLRAGQVITIRDGVTYLAIIPLRATDLGRKEEVVIARGAPGRSEPNGAAISPALTITSYNMQRGEPIPPHLADWATINTRAYGGFVVEMGDAAEYPNFDAFSQRVRSSKLDETWNATDRVVQVSYRSGADLMEAAFGTSYRQSSPHLGVLPGEQSKAFLYRRVNGKPAYLPPRIERDTTLTQQGTSGRLEKNGATLTTEPGRKAYLQTYPGAGVFTGYNPLPDTTTWSLAVPGNVTMEARGKVGLLRASIKPAEARIWIDYATTPQQTSAEMASELLVTGIQARPTVTLNGHQLSPHEIRSAGGSAYIVPLFDSLH